MTGCRIWLYGHLIAHPKLWCIVRLCPTDTYYNCVVGMASAIMIGGSDDGGCFGYTDVFVWLCC